MVDAWVPVVSALGGALIGSIASIVTMWVQTRHEAKRERSRLIVDAAIEDFKALNQLALAQSGAKKLQPLSSYIHFHSLPLRALEDGDLDAETLGRISEKQLAAEKAIATHMNRAELVTCSRPTRRWNRRSPAARAAQRPGR